MPKVNFPRREMYDSIMLAAQHCVHMLGQFVLCIVQGDGRWTDVRVFSNLRDLRGEEHNEVDSQCTAL